MGSGWEHWEVVTGSGGSCGTSTNHAHNIATGAAFRVDGVVCASLGLFGEPGQRFYYYREFLFSVMAVGGSFHWQRPLKPRGLRMDRIPVRVVEVKALKDRGGGWDGMLG